MWNPVISLPCITSTGRFPCGKSYRLKQRLIVNYSEKAYQILKDNHVNVNLTDVLAIVTDSAAGSFAKTLTCFTQSGLSIEYMYCFSLKDKSILILRTNNREAAREVIRRQNLEYICESDLAKM